MKYLIIIMLIFFNVTSNAQANNAIFTGGNDDGWAMNIYQQAGNNIYNGGIGDGWTSMQSDVTVLEVTNNSLDFPITVYPNPTTGSLRLGLRKVFSTSEVLVLNSFGQMIFSNTYQNTDSILIDISGSDGIYFVQFRYDNQTEIIKVVKR